MGWSTNHDIYLEVGKKKIFACALDWPGWCRLGKEEASAIQALVDYGPRYARVLEGTNLGYMIPGSPADLKITQRVTGNLTADFGAPDIQLTSDQQPLHPKVVARYITILKACWAAFDAAVAQANGKELHKGPRGGGRELSMIVEHVAGGEMGYMYALGRRAQVDRGKPAGEQLDRIRSQVLETIAAAAEGKLPKEGPRGGKKWPLHYYIRRAAWHVLDHAWEIEDRII